MKLGAPSPSSVGADQLRFTPSARRSMIRRACASAFYEIGACMMCGLCVEACPFDAIRMGHDYELAVFDPADLCVDLLVDSSAYEPKRKAAAATPPADTPAPAEPAATTEGGDDV